MGTGPGIGWLAQAEDFGTLLFWLVFILLPLGGRLVRWIVERGRAQAAGSGAGREPDTGPTAGTEVPDGTELWRRLLSGELPTEAPPAGRPRAETRHEPPGARGARSLEEPSREPASARAARQAASETHVAEDAIFERPLVEDGPSFEARSSVPEHRAAEEAPLAELGVHLPSASGPRARRASLGVVGELERRMGAGRPRSAPSSGPTERDPDRLRGALLWSVILAPPVALRDEREEHGAP